LWLGFAPPQMGNRFKKARAPPRRKEHERSFNVYWVIDAREHRRPKAPVSIVRAA
jgi:hypothetical protein